MRGFESTHQVKDGTVQRDIRAGLTGAVAGALATIPMTAIMTLAQRTGQLGEMPPRLLADTTLNAAGEHHPEAAEERATAAVIHLNIGALGGLLFSLLSCRANPPAPRIAQGTIFGLLIWAIAYLGFMPGVGVMPPAHEDRPNRQITMVVAHVVYGATLGWLVDRRGC